MNIFFRSKCTCLKRHLSRKSSFYRSQHKYKVRVAKYVSRSSEKTGIFTPNPAIKDKMLYSKLNSLFHLIFVSTENLPIVFPWRIRAPTQLPHSLFQAPFQLLALEHPCHHRDRQQDRRNYSPTRWPSTHNPFRQVSNIN